LAHAKVMPLLETIDLAEQRELEGPILELLLGDVTSTIPPFAVGGDWRAARIVPGSERKSSEWVLQNLQTFSPRNCRRLDVGSIPSAIGKCERLRSLDLSRCNRTGACFCMYATASNV